MKKFIALFMALLLSYFARSQNNLPDTAMILRMINQYNYYVFNQPDSGIIMFDSIIALSQKIEYSYGEASGYDNLGWAYQTKGDYARAMYSRLNAIDIFNKIKEKYEIANCNAELARLYIDLGNYRQALDHVSLSKKLFASLPDSIYLRIEGKRISKESDLLTLDYLFSKAYLEENMLDSALYYAENAAQRDFKLKDNWSAIPVLLGNIYEKMGKHYMALASYRLPTKNNYQLDFAENNFGQAVVFKKMNQLDSCKFFAEKAFDTAQFYHYTKIVMQASELLASINEHTNINEYIKYLKINNAAKDSLYNKEKLNQANNFILAAEARQRDEEAAEIKFESQKKMYLLLGTSIIFLIAGILLWRNNHHKKKANALLEIEKRNVEQAFQELKSTQQQLVQREKMASLGELTAGIAHEIQNPLNFVNNFSEVSNELLDEMVMEFLNGNTNVGLEIRAELSENLEKILHHGKRADAIVKGMLQHSRKSEGTKEPTDINALCDEYLRLSYHGLRAKDKTFNADLKTDFDNSIGKINVVPQDMGRVLLNLINNAFYAVSEKKKQQTENYEPTVLVSTKKINDKVEIKVEDNGNGIPQKIVDKIFQPFFTTKPTGSGTGLGLSLSYDIIKAHGGEIKVESKEGEGSKFIIMLPA